MTDYSIKLPESKNVHKPNVIEGERLIVNTFDPKKNCYYDAEAALTVFDTDSNGVSADELMQAYDYFVQKEKEIAVSGEKGDGIITNKDIEQIMKTDSKFDKLREKYNDDSKVVNLLSKILLSLCRLVTLGTKEVAIHILPGSIEYYIPEEKRSSIYKSSYTN